MRLNWSKGTFVLWLLGLLFTQAGLLFCRAQTARVWNGTGATNGSWADTANWATGIPDSSAESAQFGAGPDNPVTQNYSANLTIGQIEFTAAAITRTITASLGNKFTIDASAFSGVGVVNSSGNNMTLSAPIDLGSSQTWRAASSGTLTFSGAIELAGQTLTLDASGDLITISSVIASSGAGALTKTGANILSLGGAAANTFTGVTTVNDGRLELNKTANIVALGGNLVIGDGSGAANSAEVRFLRDGQMTTSATVTINADGLLALNGQDQTLGALSLNGSSITTGAGILTMNGGLTINASANSATITGKLNLGAASRTFDVPDGGAAVDLSITAVISGTGVSLTKNGAGLLSLAGNNTFDGGLTLNAGTIEFNSNRGNGTGVLTINGGVIQASATRTLDEAVSVGGNFSVSGANAMTLSGAMNLGGATRVMTVDNSALTTFSGVISNGGITKEGSGILSLSGANTFTGDITINAGTLRVGVNDAVADSVKVVINGATFDMGSKNDTIGQLEMTAGSVSGTGTLTLGANPVFHGDATGATIASKLNLGSATRTFDVPDGGAAIDLSLAGNIAGAGVGFIKDGAGFLSLGGNNTFSGGLTINAGTVELGNNNSAGSGTLGLNGGTIQASAARFISKAVSVGGDFTVSGANDLTLSGAMNLNGGTRTVTVGNSAGTFFSGVISNGGLTKDGSGSLRLSGGSANTYTGTTTVLDGLLELGKSGGVNAFGGGLVIGDGAGSANSAEARLQNNGQIPDSSSVSINTDGLLALNGKTDTVGIITMTGGSITTGAGTLTMNGDMTVNGSTSGSTITGNLGLGASTRNFAVADGTAATDLSVSAIISGTGVGLNKSGTGFLSLGAANTFTGGFTMNSGTLQFGADTAAGTGTLTLNGGAIQASGTRSLANAVTVGGDFTVGGSSALTLSGAMNLGGGTRVVTVNNSADTTFSGVISNGGLTKEGTGRLILNSASTSTFTGNLTIDAGTLMLGGNNQIANTAGLQLASGATFASQGFSDTVGTLSLSGTGTVDLGSGASVLRFANSSAITWGGGTGLTINNWSGTGSGGGTDQLYFGSDTTGLTSGQLSKIVFVNPAGYASGNYGAKILATGEVVPLAIVPEPATLATVALLGLALLGREWNRHRTSRRR